MSYKVTMAIIGIVCLLVGGAAGYFARPLVRGNNPTRNFAGRFGQRGPGGRTVGTVQSINNGTMTIKTPNGGSQIVLTNDSTTYQHVVAGTASDISTGTFVMVNGQANPDGSTTAAAIQALPSPQPSSNPQ